MMNFNDTQSALEAYKNGYPVEGFQALLNLSISGDPTAEYWAALICQENMLLFLASDLWNDLLKFDAKPRNKVAKEEYEILVWQGNLGGARDFVSKEGLFEMEGDIESRDLVTDDNKLLRVVGNNIRELLETNSDSYPTTKFREAVRELELKANLGAIASQLHHAKKRTPKTNSMLVSGHQLSFFDFAEYVDDAEGKWADIRYEAARLIGDLNTEKDKTLQKKIADIGQEAIERLFFLRGSIKVESEDDIRCLQNIGLALRDTKPVASNYYLALIQ